MSSTAPAYTYASTLGYAQDNGYTISYYVEGYINKLKSLGAPSTITGRLLTYEEANSLSSTIKGTFSYWLGSASRSYDIGLVYGGSLGNRSFWFGVYDDVRPVIVVPTNVISN